MGNLNHARRNENIQTIQIGNFCTCKSAECYVSAVFCVGGFLFQILFCIIVIGWNDTVQNFYWIGPFSCLGPILLFRIIYYQYAYLTLTYDSTQSQIRVTKGATDTIRSACCAIFGCCCCCYSYGSDRIFECGLVAITMVLHRTEPVWRCSQEYEIIFITDGNNTIYNHADIQSDPESKPHAQVFTVTVGEEVYAVFKLNCDVKFYDKFMLLCSRLQATDNFDVYRYSGRSRIPAIENFVRDIINNTEALQ